MDRLIAPNSVPLAQADTAPATGTPQYATDGNPATNVPATQWPAYAFNTLQDEIYNVIIAAGLTPNRNAWNQLLTAIQSMLQGSTTNVGVDTGAANAYVVAFTPALPNPVPWVPFWFEVAHTNTGASTLNATRTVEPLVGAAHAALQGGELVAKGNALVYWNPTLNSNAGAYVLLFCSGAAEQVAPATQSGHAMQLGQATGRLLRTSVYRLISGVLSVSVNGGSFTATGGANFTPLALTNSIVAEVIGGGGGSGSTLNPSTGNTSMTGGGGGANVQRGLFTSGFSSLAPTVGVGGTGGVGSAVAGGTGGTSSLGALISAGGGGGSAGGLSFATTTNAAASGGGGSGTGAGGNLASLQGATGANGFSLTGALLSGAGGSNGLGYPGAQGVGSGQQGVAGPNVGSGASGATSASGGGAQSGAAGSPGQITVWEYQ